MVTRALIPARDTSTRQLAWRCAVGRHSHLRHRGRARGSDLRRQRLPVCHRHPLSGPKLSEILHIRPECDFHTVTVRARENHFARPWIHRGNGRNQLRAAGNHRAGLGRLQAGMPPTTQEDTGGRSKFATSWETLQVWSVTVNRFFHSAMNCLRAASHCLSDRPLAMQIWQETCRS